MGNFSTLALQDPFFDFLSTFFMDEFGLLPRIGCRDWNELAEGPVNERRAMDGLREDSIRAGKNANVLWTAYQVRGCMVAKFTAREFDGARSQLGGMLREGGNLGRAG